MMRPRRRWYWSDKRVHNGICFVFNPQSLYVPGILIAMSIFGIIIYCLIAAVVVIMVAPFVLTTRFSSVPNNRNGILEISWLHPSIALVKYNMGTKSLELRFFGWVGNGAAAKKGKETPPSVSTSGSHADASPQSNETLKPSAVEQPRPVDGRTGQSAAPPDGKSRKMEQTPVERSNTSKSGQGAKNDTIPSSPNRFTWSKLKKTIAILRQGHCGRKLFRWSLRLLRLSLRIIRFDHLRLHARAGVEDPAETGRIYGYFAALHSTFFSNRKNMDVSLEPRFMSNVLEVEGRVGLKTSIAGMLLPFFVAIITFPYLTVFFVWRRLKKVYTMSDVGKKV